MFQGLTINHLQIKKCIKTNKNTSKQRREDGSNVPLQNMDHILASQLVGCTGLLITHLTLSHQNNLWFCDQNTGVYFGVIYFNTLQLQKNITYSFCMIWIRLSRCRPLKLTWPCVSYVWKANVKHCWYIWGSDLSVLRL